jgi:hypothetical protein
VRYYLTGGRTTQLTALPLQSHRFERTEGGYILMQVADHSLELKAQIGRALLETRFGELRVELMDPLPETIFTSCVGRMIDEVIEHRAWRERGWRIIAVKEPDWLVPRQTLIVAMGVVPYRIPRVGQDL